MADELMPLAGMKPTLAEILAYAEEAELLLMEPRELYDPCIVGIVQRFHSEFIVYSRARVMAVLMDMGGDEEVDPDYPPEVAAQEYFDYNVVGGWVGDATPGYLEDDLEGLL